MSNRAPKLTKPKKQRQKVEQKKTRTSLIGLMLGLATVIGVPSAVVFWFPRVTVAISDPVDSSDPFSSSVTITNNGFLPLDSVSTSLAVVTIAGNGKAPFRAIHGVKGYGSRVLINGWNPHDLGVDDRFTVALNDFNYPDRRSDILGYADIAVVVKYRVPILRIQREKVFPIETRQQTNENFYWYAKSLGQ